MILIIVKCYLKVKYSILQKFSSVYLKLLCKDVDQALLLVLEFSQLQNVNYDLRRDDPQHIIGQQVALGALRACDKVPEILIALQLG